MVSEDAEGGGDAAETGREVTETGGDAAETGEDAAETGGDAAETGESVRQQAVETEARPRPELRRVRLRDPRRVAELGRNGRVVESVFREGDDSWEVLLVTYEGELSRNRNANRDRGQNR